MQRKKMCRNLSKKNKAAIFIASLILITAQSALHAYETALLRRSQSYRSFSMKVRQKFVVPKGYHEGLSFNGPDLLLANGEKGKIWVLNAVSGNVKSSIEPISDFTESVLPLPEDQFFTTEWEDKKLYRASLAENKLIPEIWISVSPAHPAGIAWTGEQLYMIIWTRGIGTKYDLLKLDKNMALSERISVQIIEEPTQLAWDGKYLWVSSWYDQHVYKIDVVKWEVLGAFKSPVPRTTGIAWDGKYMWLTGTYSDLYKIEISQ